ncbi:MAG: hypothetical protein ACRCSF_02245 [Mycobacteriaceae bacterium]
MLANNDFRDYMRKRNPFFSAEPVTVADLTDQEKATVPAQWWDIVQHQGKPAVDIAVAMWRTVVGEDLPHTVRALSVRGFDVTLALVCPQDPDTSKIILAYGIKTRPTAIGDIECLYGFAPHTQGSFPSYWPILSDNIGRITTELHNGILRRFGGFAPLDRCVPISQWCEPDDREYLDIEKNDMPPERWPDLNSLIAFYSNGRVGICADVSTLELRCWEYDIDISPRTLWATLDKWMLYNFGIYNPEELD